YAFAFVQSRFEAGAAGRAIRVCLQLLELGDDRELIQQFIDALAGGGAGFDEGRVAAHVVGQNVEAVKLLPRLVDVGAGQIDLVDRDNEGDAGGLGVVDGFLGLRHDAVVGGDDDDGHVRHL